AQEEPTEWPLTFRPLLTSSTLAAEVADFVMRCHERLIDPLRLGEMARERADWRALPAFLDRYRAALREAGKIDYGLLVAEAVEILSSTDPGFSHVIVDEYQDTSPPQARLARLPARSGNLTVAGDPNQSIYSFRGAEPGNVQDFRHEVSEARGRVYVLGRSFRVPAAVLASAHRLVAANPPSFGPAPVPADHDGGVEVYTFDQRSAEAEWIAGAVERLWHSEGLPLTSIAVLVRCTRHLLPELSRALDRRAIPHARPDVRLLDHPAHPPAAPRRPPGRPTGHPVVPRPRRCRNVPRGATRPGSGAPATASRPRRRHVSRCRAGAHPHPAPPRPGVASRPGRCASRY